jgi:hypothetical protein
MLLTNFYKDLQAWLDAGMPAHPVFNKKRALCASLSVWSSDSCSMQRSLAAQFKRAKLCPVFPFNKPARDYHTECFNSTVYDNVERLAWVKQQAAKKWWQW